MLVLAFIQRLLERVRLLSALTELEPSDTGYAELALGKVEAGDRGGADL